jgi:hypothetical protein
MGRLLLIRHGESEGNRAASSRSRPKCRSPTRVASRWSAPRSGSAARYRPTRIVTSPFRRAQQTAEILARRLGLEVMIEPDLRERFYGDLTGRPYASLEPCPTSIRRCTGSGVRRAAARRSSRSRHAPAAPRPRGALGAGRGSSGRSHGAVMMALWVSRDRRLADGTGARNAGLMVVEHENGAYVGATRSRRW